MDGTFRITPRRFYQVFTVHAFKEKRILTIIEKFDSGDYSLNEYINSLSKWMGFNFLSSTSLLHFCNIVLLHLLYYLLRWNGVDEMAQTGCRQNGTTNTTIENIRLWMYTLNGNVWYLLCLVWSSSTCFRLENISYKWLFHTSGKITTALGAIFKTTQNEKQKTSDYECTH